MDFDSDDSDRASPAIRKKKTVSFRTPSDDEEEPTFGQNKGDRDAAQSVPTGEETEKKTFNLRKYFG